ncbi:MAG: AIM24 family protein [Methanothrix sp.]|nr:AIM24 family protein [Methanothrix sp.]
MAFIFPCFALPRVSIFSRACSICLYTLIHYCEDSYLCLICLAAPFPGRILPIDLGAFGGSILCQKDSFICAARGIEIEVAFTKKLAAGLFVGVGFILQRLLGNGLAFIHVKMLAHGDRLLCRA